MNRFLDSLRQAMDALADHKLRTALSVLGITIGIAAVMAVSTISKGGNHVIYSELETFGLNSVWVYRNWNTEDNGRQRREGSGIVSEDFQSLQRQRETLGIRHMTPIVYPSDRWQVSQARRNSDAQILGVGRDYTRIINDELTAGTLVQFPGHAGAPTGCTAGTVGCRACAGRRSRAPGADSTNRWSPVYGHRCAGSQESGFSQ